MEEVYDLTNSPSPPRKAGLNTTRKSLVICSDDDADIESDQGREEYDEGSFDDEEKFCNDENLIENKFDLEDIVDVVSSDGSFESERNDVEEIDDWSEMGGMDDLTDNANANDPPPTYPGISEYFWFVGVMLILRIDLHTIVYTKP